jgi:hypothetical protein
MSRHLFLLADVELDDLMRGAPLAHPMLHQALVVCGAVLLATLPAVVWAAFFRKRNRRRRVHHYHVHHAQDSVNTLPAPAGGTGALPGVPAESGAATPRQNGHHSLAAFPKGSKRRRRHGHRPLNPTLAETGGLPPVRTDRPAEPSS